MTVPEVQEQQGEAVTPDEMRAIVREELAAFLANLLNSDEAQEMARGVGAFLGELQYGPDHPHYPDNFDPQEAFRAVIAQATRTFVDLKPVRFGERS